MKTIAITVLAITVLATLNPKPAAAEYEIEPATNVVAVVIRVENLDHNSWKTETIKFAKPTDTVIKPCPERRDSICLYSVTAAGREKEVFSYSQGFWSEPRYVFAPAKPVKKAKR